MTALEVRLGIRRIVIASEHEIIECVVARELDHLLIGGEILLTASHPVGQGFLGNQAAEKLIFLLLAARQTLHLLLVLEDRVAEDIGTVVAVIARLFMARSLARARRAHDGAEHVKLHLRMFLAERLEAVGARQHLILGILMLARAHETAVQHGIRRNDCGIGILGILLQPVPELIRLAEIIAAAEHIIGRHDHLIAQLLDDLRRLLVRDWPVVVRNIKDLLYFILCLVMRRSRWHGDQQRAQDSHEHDDALAQRIAPFSFFSLRISILRNSSFFIRLTGQMHPLLMYCQLHPYRTYWYPRSARQAAPA